MQNRTTLDRSTVTLRAAVALMVLLFLLFALVLSTSIYRAWSDAQKRAEDRAFAASQVVATNARWVSELSRQALARVDEALGPDIDANVDVAGALIREAVATLPGSVKSYVVAADGRTLFSTDPKVKPIDVRDRDYFAAVAGGARWYVSPLLVSRLDGQQIFVFSKRLERGGQFVGAAIVSFDVDMLRDIWQSLEFDDLSTISFVRADGQLVARYPRAEGPLDLSGYSLFTQYLKSADAGTYNSVSPADGVARIVGYRRVPETDLIAVASISADAAFALFRHNTLLTIAFAVPTALALGGAVIWIFRLLKQDEETRRQLFEALQLNRLLVRDTHHRVKNNLQAIMSMVRMHAIPDELKHDLQTRITAMSAVHEHVYRLDQFSEVDAMTLIPGIVDPLLQGYGRAVGVDYDIEPILVDHDFATPLALLVSELVTNALKYAFPGNRPGMIRIGLRRTVPGRALLTIADDGIGFDAQRSTPGLGRRLVKAMLIQLNGTSSHHAADSGMTIRVDISVGKPQPPGSAARFAGMLRPA